MILPPKHIDKALLAYTNCVVGGPMHTKGLVLRIKVPIQLILHSTTSNSHKECYYTSCMHTKIIYIAVISRIQAHVDFRPGCTWFKINNIYVYVASQY